MKRNPRMTTVKARALTDPEPMFVSLVTAGANQRSFRTVKTEGAVAPSPSPREATQKDAAMTTATLTTPTGFEIQSLRFDGPTFDTREKVEAWLAEGGYSDYDLVQLEDSTFDVGNTAVEFEPGSVERIDDAVPGLTAFIGKVLGAEVTEKTDAETVAEIATSNPSHVDVVSTLRTEGLEATETAEAVQPVALTEDETLNLAMRAAMTDVEVTIKGMNDVSRLSDVLRALGWMVEDAEYGDMDEDSVKEIKKASRILVMQLSKAMSGTVAALELKFKSIFHPEASAIVEADAPADAPVPSETVALATAPVDETPATPLEVAPEVVAEKADWQVAVEALSIAMAALAAKMDSNSTASDDAAKAAKAESERVEQETLLVSQTRKGSDLTGTLEAATLPDPKVAEQAAFAAKRLRSALGGSNH